MTIVSRQLMLMTIPGGTAEVVVTWDALTFSPEDGSPEYLGEIISIVITNTSAQCTVIGIFRRGNGVVEAQRELLPSSQFTYTGQGPIQDVEDIPNIGLTYRL